MSDSSAKRAGDAWGRLAGLVVDACKSHHESHIAGAAKTGGRPTGHREKPAADDDDEILRIVLTTEQRCRPTWTNTKGQAELLVEIPTQMTLQYAAMHPLVAGAFMSTGATDGQPLPQTFNTQGKYRVVVSISQTLPRGMYIGRLSPGTGGPPDVPVLIYIDDVV